MLKLLKTWATFSAESFRLPNGMRVVLQPDRRIPSVALHLCYASGSRHEPPALCGLAHLCEHLSFRPPQAEDEQSYSQLVEDYGGEGGGATFHDRTSFSTTLPSHFLSLGLFVEACRMSEGAPPLTPEMLRVQRDVVLQELRQRVQNRPYGQSFELVQGLLYPPGHPYRLPPGGLPERLHAITCRDAEEFINTNYRPGRAVLAVVGDFAPEEAAREIEGYFGSIPARSTNGGGLNGGLPDLQNLPGERRAAVTERVPFPRCYLTFRAAGGGQAGWYAASLLTRSLAVGRLSPLRRKLINERRVAQEVQAQVYTMREAATFAFVATAAAGVGGHILEAALVEAVDELLAEGVSEADLGRAKKKALTDHYSLMQRLDRRAESLACAVAYLDDPAHAATEGHCYDRLGADDVSGYGREHLRPEGRALLTINPLGATG